MDCFVGAQHAAPQQCTSRIEESVFQSNGNQQASWFGQRNLGSIGDCSRSACWFGCAVRGTLCLAVSVQHSREKAARVRLRIARHLLGSARRDDLAALVPALGAQIDQPVRGFDDVKIVFDDQQRSAALQQLAERAEELRDVVEMQTCSRFVQNVEDALIIGAAEVRGQLQALRFSAGKRCRRLPETQVAESNFIQDSEFGNNLGYVNEKRQRFANRQLQYLVDIFPVITDFQNAALEARAPALFADEFDVRQKLHLHGDSAVALTGFAAASGHVERKMTGGVAAPFRIGRFRKYISDRVKRFEIRGRIRTRRAADGRLIHNDHFPDIRIAFQPFAEFLDAAANALRAKRLVQHVVNQRGLARAADAGDYRQRPERDHHIQILEVLQTCAVEPEQSARGFVAHVGHGNPQLTAEVPASYGFLLLEHGRIRARKKKLAAEFARAGTEIDDAIRGLDGIGIVFDDQNRVPQIAKRLENIDEPLRVARMEADGRFVQHVEGANEMRTERRCELDPLRFSAGERGGQPVEREVIEAHFIQKLQPRSNLFQNSVRDFQVPFGELQLGKESARFFNGELAHLGDGFSRHAHGAGLGAQTSSATFRTPRITSESAEENADMQLVFLALQQVEKTFDPFVL